MRISRTLLVAALLGAALTLAAPTSTPAGATADCTVEQITDTTAGPTGNANPAISADGSVIAFQSDRSHPGAANADGNLEIVRYDVDAGTFAAVTGAPAAPTPTSTPPSTPTATGSPGLPTATSSPAWATPTVAARSSCGPPASSSRSPSR